MPDRDIPAVSRAQPLSHGSLRTGRGSQARKRLEMRQFRAERRVVKYNNVNELSWLGD